MAIAVLLALSCSAAGQETESRLQGCTDPAAMASALSKLRIDDWRDVSVAQLQETWPTALRGLECDQRTCTSMVHEGRIIDGEAECVEVFEFRIAGGQGVTPREQLYGITIHYTARTGEETVTAAKTLSSAIGLADQDVATIGADSYQRFQWENKALRKESAVLELKWSRLGSNWNLFFSTGRDIVGTTSGKR